MWCWRRLLEKSTRRSTQSILKETSPEYSLEVLMLKLKFQYFGHLMQRTDSLKRPWCWERLKAGEEYDRGWDGRMASLTQWTWVWASSRSWWWHATAHGGSQRVRHDWETELNWITNLPLFLHLRPNFHYLFFAHSRNKETSYSKPSELKLFFLTILPNCSFWKNGLVSLGHCAQSLSCVQLFVTPYTVAHQAPLFMGILEWVAISFSILASRNAKNKPNWFSLD